MINKLGIIIIGILLLICIFLGMRSDIHNVTEYKTVVKTDTSYIIKNDTLRLTKFHTVRLPSNDAGIVVDTNAIISSYLSTKATTDTFRIHGGRIIIKDTLKGDTLNSQTVEVLDSTMKISDSVFISNTKSEIFAGVSFGALPGVFFIYKKKRTVIIVGFNNGFYGGIGRKIK